MLEEGGAHQFPGFGGCWDALFPSGSSGCSQNSDLNIGEPILGGFFLSKIEVKVEMEKFPHGINNFWKEKGK